MTCINLRLSGRKRQQNKKITNTFPWQPHQKVDKTPYPKETNTNNGLSQLQDGFPMSKASFNNEKKNLPRMKNFLCTLTLTELKVFYSQSLSQISILKVSICLSANIRTVSDLSTIQFRLIFKGHKSLEYCCLVILLTSNFLISYAESNDSISYPYCAIRHYNIIFHTTVFTFHS